MTNNKVFRISLQGEGDGKLDEKFREVAKEKFDLCYNSEKSVRSEYECELGSLKVIGRGAYFLVEKVGKELLNEFLAEEVSSPYIRQFGDTIMNVFDNVPTYSRITIEGEFEGYGETGRYKVSFLKVAPEENNLREALISLVDYEEKYRFL